MLRFRPPRLALEFFYPWEAGAACTPAFPRASAGALLPLPAWESGEGDPLPAAPAHVRSPCPILSAADGYSDPPRRAPASLWAHRSAILRPLGRFRMQIGHRMCGAWFANQTLVARAGSNRKLRRVPNKK